MDEPLDDEVVVDSSKSDKDKQGQTTEDTEAKRADGAAKVEPTTDGTSQAPSPAEASATRSPGAAPAGPKVAAETPQPKAAEAGVGQGASVAEASTKSDQEGKTKFPRLTLPTIRGFVQTDYVRSQLSENELSDGTGQPLNQDRFLVRRGRLTILGKSERVSEAWFEYVIEGDLNTFDGTRVGVRQVEAAIAMEPLGAGASLPLTVRFGAGVIPAPFGYEVYGQSDADRWFTERSLMGQAFFPGQVDVGARLSLIADFHKSSGASSLRADVAVQNGEPLAGAAFPGRDPNSQKDVLGRVVLESELSEALDLELGFSAVKGTGFSPGTAPTKDTLIWRDFNEDGIVQTGELSAIAGAAGAPSENFERWGLGAELRLFVELAPLGTLGLYSEAALAKNLDRAVRPSDPVFLGRDQRQKGFYAGLTQELGEHALVGFRYDTYRPEIDDTALEGGELVRSKETFQTYTMTAGGRLSAGGVEGRLIVEYAIQHDPLGRDASGRPADLSNNRFTTRAQVRF